MVFRLIGVVLELLWAIAKREAEIESLKRREDKSEEKLKTLSDKVREMETHAKILESRRESDNERLKALELRREFQSEQIARLEMLTKPNVKTPLPQGNDRPERTLSDLMEEAIENLKQKNASVAPTQPTDN